MAEPDEQIDLQNSEYYEVIGNEEWSEEQAEPDGEEGALPVFSMAGISSPGTMRLRGVIRGRAVTVLIDSGASHNFISSSLIPIVQLTPDEFGVQLGNGSRQRSEGVCKGVAMMLAGCEVVADYFFSHWGEWT